MLIMTKVASVMLTSFLLNIPLGMWRVRTRRFSLKWFISIHLAVPLIFLIRVFLQLSYWVIPFLIISAVLGQIAGGILAKRFRFYFIYSSRTYKRRSID